MEAIYDNKPERREITSENIFKSFFLLSFTSFLVVEKSQQ